MSPDEEVQPEDAQEATRKTDRLTIPFSDRVILEGKIERLDATQETAAKLRREEIDQFYRNRMIPLEERVEQRTVRSNNRAWFAVGVSMCAFLVAMTVLITVLILHL